MTPTLSDVLRRVDSVALDVAAIRAREQIMAPEVARRLEETETRLRIIETQAAILSGMAADVKSITEVVTHLQVWRAYILGGAAVLGVLGGAVWQVVASFLR